MPFHSQRGDSLVDDADPKDNEKEERKRMLNRLSKSRCKKRKLDLFRRLEREISSLSEEHKYLRNENEQLRQEFEECYNAHVIRERCAREIDQSGAAYNSTSSSTISSHSNQLILILALLQRQAILNLAAPSAGSRPY